MSKTNPVSIPKIDTLPVLVCERCVYPKNKATAFRGYVKSNGLSDTK